MKRLKAALNWIGFLLVICLMLSIPIGLWVYSDILEEEEEAERAREAVKVCRTHKGVESANDVLIVCRDGKSVAR